jgi:alpha-mannosidase
VSTDIHVVTHTHWDREWYHTAERFRQRLVLLIDELIDDPPGADESFLLDGQAIVLEDYAAVRPDRAERLYALLRDGRVEAGPWYVLADELIPSGEAIVRNLLAGRRLLQRHAVTPPAVLYCPDSFGHPAALPEIAAGFGLPLIVLWRGYGSTRWPAGDSARWRAPSGAESLLYHLPRAGYEFGSHLPSGGSEAATRWAEMRDELVPRSTTGVMLLPNGADHHARQAALHDALDAIEEVGRSAGVHRSSLRAFAEAFVAGAGSDRRDLPVVEGELRDSYGYTWALQGTFATRAHEKRLNARTERLLLREAEPFAALAAVSRVRPGASDAAARAALPWKPLLDAAWQTLLRAHPHDTLCGCSIDAVASAMEQRIDAAAMQAAGIRDDALHALVAHDPVRARTAPAEWTPIVIVRNPAPRVRSGVAIVDVQQFLADVAVGPGSAPAQPVDVSPPRGVPTVDGLGRGQILSRRVAHARTESPRHYPDDDLVSEMQVAYWIHDAPAYGIASYQIADRASRAAPRPPADELVRVERRGTLLTISNAHLSGTVDAHSGVVTFADADGTRRIPSLLGFFDEADLGDSYTSAPRPRPHRVDCRGARIVHRGPLRGELAIRFRVLGTAAKARRVDVELEVRIALDAGAPFLRLDVRGENRRPNHRLRLRVATDVADGDTWADAAFGPVLRQPVVATPAESAIEQPPATAPLHRYVSLFDRDRGCTLFSDGLAEYETVSDGAIAVTLVRAIGELSRNDIPERPGHAGWPSPIPAAQCLGPFAASFAVMLHGPRSTETIDIIERAADDVLLPLAGDTLRSALAVPDPVAGVELMGTGLAFSAAKPSEDGEWLVLRCVNLTETTVAGAWRVPFTPAAARLARIDETSIQEIEIVGRDIRFNAGPRAVVTMLVR